MASYEITDPDTGETAILEFDSPPTQEEARVAMANRPKPEQKGLLRRAGDFIADIPNMPQRAADQNKAEVMQTPLGQAAYKMAQDLSPAQALARLYAGGTADVMRGIGAGDQQTKASQLTEQSIKAQYPIAGPIAEAAGQIIPTIPASIGIPGFAEGAAGRVLLSAGAGAAEGNVISRGTGGDSADITGSTLIGGALGPIGEIPGAVKAISRGFRRLFGKEMPTTELLTTSGTPTPQLQQILDQTGTTVDDLARAGESQSAVAFTEDASRAAAQQARGEVPDLSQIAAQAAPDAQVMELLGQVGIPSEKIPFSMVATSPEAKALGSTLRAIATSQERQNYDEAAIAVRDYAKSQMEGIGAVLAKGDLSENVLKGMRDTHNSMHAIEKPAWELLDQKIKSSISSTGAARVVVRDPVLKAKLLAEKAMRPTEGLPPLEAKVLRMMEGRPTYWEISDLRQSIGDAIGNLPRGEFAGVAERQLKSMYGAMADLQSKAAGTLIGQGELKAVNEMTKARKALEDQIDFFTNGDIRGSMVQKLTAAKSGLANQDYQQLDNLMANLPDAAKTPVMASIISDAMKLTADTASEKGIDKNGFIKVWQNVRANEGLASRFKGQLGDQGYDKINNLYTLAQAMQRAEKVPSTGMLATAMSKYTTDGVMAKLLSMGGSAIGGKIKKGVDIVSAVASNPQTGGEAIDNLIASPTLKRALTEATQNLGTSAEEQAILRMNNQLNNAQVVQRALAKASPEVRNSINSAGGFLNYLLAKTPEDQQQTAE